MSKAARQRSARERLREQQRREAVRKRLMRRLGLAGGAIAVIVIVVVVAVVVQSQRHHSSPEFHGKVPAAQVLSDGGIEVAKPGVKGPKLDIWEDFQCPICQKFESINGDTVKRLAAEGKVRVVYHPIAIIDQRSVRAGSAAQCAAHYGKYMPYHDLLYAKQPPEKPVQGFTLDDLKAYGKQVGITKPGFAKCVDQQKYAGTVLKATKHAGTMKGFQGTPTLYLNGKVLGSGTTFSSDKLTQAVEQAGSSS
ncbi:MAG: DsbA family protein [Streptosporangiaceae bacterium]